MKRALLLSSIGGSPLALAACLLAACALAACAPPAPAGTSPPAAAREGQPLRVVTYNIRHGAGSDDSLDLERTAAVLRRLDPDIVALQEVDERVARSGGVDQAARLGELLGMRHAFGSFMDYQGGRYGLALLARHPIRRAAPLRLRDGNEPRVALVAELALPDSSSLTAISVHFDWVANDSFRYAQASQVAAMLDTLSTPYVLLGDFNDEPGSRTLALFQARAAEAMKPAAAHFTFSAARPAKEIDFIFVAPAARWEIGRVEVVPEAVASDHRPVLAELVLRPVRSGAAGGRGNRARHAERPAAVGAAARVVRLVNVGVTPDTVRFRPPGSRRQGAR